ncbi:hypothetical protein HPB50_002036 [Hyalomma asiaticum]|uniref:Uncharacterized protein n=1 Tax=Hyalomma asiaticum TaxID=266040 RepID=A0ACB7SH11_HYAAI|nr:hypothetical protein HPB50_002036 [Hyalomma asiaticum]
MLSSPFCFMLKVLIGTLLIPLPGFFNVSGGLPPSSYSTFRSDACDPMVTLFPLVNDRQVPTLDSFKHLAWQLPSSTDTAGAVALLKHHFDGLLLGRDIAADMSLPRLFAQERSDLRLGLDTHGRESSGSLCEICGQIMCRILLSSSGPLLAILADRLFFMVT